MSGLAALRKIPSVELFASQSKNAIFALLRFSYSCVFEPVGHLRRYAFHARLQAQSKPCLACPLAGTLVRWTIVCFRLGPTPPGTWN